MRINELAASIDTGKLMALADFLTRRAQDVGSKKTISGLTFVNLAKSLQIPLTITQLKDLSAQSPLNNLIADVQGPDDAPSEVKVFFKTDATDDKEMSVAQARDTVDSMAKRAAKKGI